MKYIKILSTKNWNSFLNNYDKDISKYLQRIINYIIYLKQSFKKNINIKSMDKNIRDSCKNVDESCNQKIPLDLSIIYI